MQNRKTILAAAVAAAVGTPAVQAEMTVYGRVNNALDLNNIGAESSTHLSSVSSRFGLQGETTLDSGLTVHGRYEFDVTSDREAGHDLLDADFGSERTTGVNDIRVATAGISGGFGRVDVGNQWTAYFDMVGTHFDPFNTLGFYLYSSAGGGLYRGSNTIKYSNSWGPVSMEADLRLNDETSNESSHVAESARGQGFGIGFSFKAGSNLTIGAAYDVDGNRTLTEDAYLTGLSLQERIEHEAMTEAEQETAFETERDRIDRGDETRFGVAAKLNVSDAFHIVAGLQNYDPNGSADDDELTSTFFRVGGDMTPKTNWVIRYATVDNGKEATATAPATADATQLTWGVYNNVGGGLQLYYEGTMVTNENASSVQDGDRHLLGIRVSF